MVEHADRIPFLYVLQVAIDAQHNHVRGHLTVEPGAAADVLSAMIMITITHELAELLVDQVERYKC